MRRRNLWLTGIGGFTALLFGFLAYFNYRVYTFRHENYYLAGMVVFGTIAVLSIYAVVNGWRREPPEPGPFEDDETDGGPS
jgi:hypothetical protein